MRSVELCNAAVTKLAQMTIEWTSQLAKERRIAVVILQFVILIYYVLKPTSGMRKFALDWARNFIGEYYDDEAGWKNTFVTVQSRGGKEQRYFLRNAPEDFIAEMLAAGPPEECREGEDVARRWVRFVKDYGCERWHYKRVHDLPGNQKKETAARKDECEDVDDEDGEANPFEVYRDPAS